MTHYRVSSFCPVIGVAYASIEVPLVIVPQACSWIMMHELWWNDDTPENFVILRNTCRRAKSHFENFDTGFLIRSGRSSPGLKPSQRDSGHSPPYRAEVVDECSCTYTAHMSTWLAQGQLYLYVIICMQYNETRIFTCMWGIPSYVSCVVLRKRLVKFDANFPYLNNFSPFKSSANRQLSEV